MFAYAKPRIVKEKWTRDNFTVHKIQYNSIVGSYSSSSVLLLRLPALLSLQVLVAHTTASKFCIYNYPFYIEKCIVLEGSFIMKQSIQHGNINS